jgi:hypothetical protein
MRTSVDHLIMHALILAMYTKGMKLKMSEEDPES